MLWNAEVIPFEAGVSVEKAQKAFIFGAVAPRMTDEQFVRWGKADRWNRGEHTHLITYVTTFPKCLHSTPPGRELIAAGLSPSNFATLCVCSALVHTF